MSSSNPSQSAALPSISVSVKAAIVRDGRILLLSYDDHAGFHYNLPGGKAREGEGLRDAVKRKVLEETGFVVQADRLLCVVQYVPEKWNNEFGIVQKIQSTFLATIISGDDPQLSDPIDPFQVGFEWLPLENLGEVYLLPRVGDQIIKALEGKLQDPFLDKW